MKEKNQVIFVLFPQEHLWLSRRGSREKKHITQLSVNQHFGEVSFSFGSPAIAKVKSTKYSLLGVINV